MNRLELEDNGFPMTAKTLRFLQETNRAAFEALARTYGNSILYGVERAGSSWTDGAIIYNGEIVPFVGGGVAGTYFRIDETVENAVYKSGVSLPAYFTRVAKPQATNANGGVLISSLGRVNEVIPDKPMQALTAESGFYFSDQSGFGIAGVRYGKGVIKVSFGGLGGRVAGTYKLATLPFAPRKKQPVVIASANQNPIVDRMLQAFVDVNGVLYIELTGSLVIFTAADAAINDIIDIV